MCELLGMSANVPTDIVFSFSGLMQRGGKTGPHKDGWGIAFYEGNGIRLFQDPSASIDSEVARFVKSYPIKSQIVVSHIRKANRGKVSLKNTHPFVRELWGNYWTFAHNGQLKGIKKYPVSFYQPVGTTDSEHAFCYILSEIRKKFRDRRPSDSELFQFLRKMFTQMHSLGVSNVLLSDSRSLYAFCSTKLCWITRRSPFGKASLIDTDMQVDFREVTSEKDIVTVVATAPLTRGEHWTAMKSGECIAFRNGKQYK